MVRCTICRVASAKPRFCMTRCKGSAADKWAKAAVTMADNGIADGGGHERMLSGDVIWCNTCGSYADLRADGLTQPCTGKHIGPWKGGGKRGQLTDLRRCIHPKSRSTLPPPIAEATMAIDVAVVASHSQQQAAKKTQARYTAKDKAMARRHALDPQSALTEE